MLFRKDQPRSCSYCNHATVLENGVILCTKKGIRSDESTCSSFSYDPCKRIPPMPKAPDFKQYCEEDFKL